jgi:hypothetical protein
MDRRIVRRAALALALSTCAARSALGHQPDERVPIDWRHAGPGAPWSDVPAPAAPDVPADLEVAPAPPVAAAREAPPPRAPDAVEAAAARASTEAARDAVRSLGWRACWRAGFARGLAMATSDPRVGAREGDAGRRAGALDPRVPPLAEHFAGEAASSAAESDAEAVVRRMFMDLSRAPGRGADAHASPSGPSPAFAGPFATEPRLSDVFAEKRPARSRGLSVEGARAWADWRIAPDDLARGGAPAAGDARWTDAAAAFDSWRSRQPRGSPWSRLAVPDRDRFRVVFLARFDAALREADAGLTREAWRLGFADGWGYGATVQGEWSYRRGFAAGFDAAIREAATRDYPYAYARAYDDAFDRRFEAWSSTARPGIAALRVTDASGDGVFEPGEGVLVEAELVNYGGGRGTLDLIASGRGLGPPSRIGVDLDGRGPVAGTEHLSLHVDERAAVPSRATVALTISDARADAPIVVSRPLAFEGAPSLGADRIGGRVTVSAPARNTSRRDARATVRVESLTLARSDQEVDVGAVPAGARRDAALTIDGIHPLDLIGAETRWKVTIVRDGTIDDARELSLPPVAADLTNPDLMDFMVGLARTPDVSRADVEDSRGLMMDRLRADWQRATAADGNPYRRDFETGGAETALGELVRVARTGRRSFVSPQVFDGLGSAAMSLADDLPGAHPLLRKWMKKLAQRVG